MSASSPTKIAFVSNTSWSIYNFRIELIRSLIAHGFDVFVLAPKDSYSTKIISEGARFVPIGLENYSVNPIKDIQLFIQLYRLYRLHHFDHIFHYTIKPNIYGSLAAKLTNTSSVAITTGLGRLFNFSNPFIRRLSLFLYKVAAKSAREVWFLNSRDQADFIRLGIVSKKRTCILPSEGINTNKFVPGQQNKPTSFTRFLFAGRLLKDKGLLEYVDAARFIKSTDPKVKFEVLGFLDDQGSNAVKLNEIMEWHRSGVIHYLGSTEDVRPYIARADCLVFPSYYREGISRILLEAASMETPIITTKNIGCEEVVKHGVNGLLCKPRSSESLVHCINEFLALCHEDRKVMGKQGRIFVKEHFDLARIITIYLAHIHRLIQPKELVYSNDKTPLDYFSKAPITLDILDFQPNLDEAN